MPDISGSVYRFIADISYEKRTVHLDSTISKSKDANLEIAICRFSDGKVQKDKNSIISEL